MDQGEINRRAAEREHDHLAQFSKQNNDAAFKSSEVALRTVLLINGGAAVAILAFIGNIIKDNASVSQLSEISASLLWFAAGVVVAPLGMACAYFTNLFDANAAASQTRTWEYPYSQPGPMTRRWERRSLIAHTLAVAFAFASLGLFVGGIWRVHSAIPLLATAPAPTVRPTVQPAPTPQNK
jgi:hypothetical protein